MITLTYLCFTSKNDVYMIALKGSESAKQLAIKTKWLSDGNICIDKDFDVESFYDIGEDWRKRLCVEKGADIIILNETVCRLKTYNAHMTTLEARKKEIKYGYAICTCTGGDVTIIMNEKNRAYLEGGFPAVNKWAPAIKSEFPNLQIQTGNAVEDWMVLDPDCVPDIELQVTLLTEAIYQTVNSVQGIVFDATGEPVEPLPGSIQYDFEDATLSLADFEAKNYITQETTGFDAMMQVPQYKQTTLFAQPQAYQLEA